MLVRHVVQCLCLSDHNSVVNTLLAPERPEQAHGLLICLQSRQLSHLRGLISLGGHRLALKSAARRADDVIECTER